MRVKHLLFGVGLVSCLAVACTGDDEQTLPGQGGSTSTAGASGKAGGSGKAGSAGTTNTGGDPGNGGVGPGPGEGGAAGDAPQGFTDFVHELVNQETKDTNTPASVNGRRFPDATDDHGHYIVPATDFADLF